MTTDITELDLTYRDRADTEHSVCCTLHVTPAIPGRRAADPLQSYPGEPEYIELVSVYFYADETTWLKSQRTHGDLDEHDWWRLWKQAKEEYENA